MIVNVMVFLTQMLLPVQYEAWFFNTFALHFPAGAVSVFREGDMHRLEVCTPGDRKPPC